MKFTILFLILSVCSASLGTHVECDFKFIMNNYYCQSVKVTEASDPFFYVTGDHQSGKKDADVTHLSFMNGAQELTSIPANIHTVFSNLIHLHIVGTQINEITIFNLLNLEKLQVFHSMGLPISTLPSNLFFYNRKLKDVRFYGSHDRINLQHIEPNLLGGLTDLEIVEFRNHSCIQSRIANSEADIRALNDELHVLCPPLETTTYEYISTSTEPYYCPSACSQRINELERRLNEMETKLGWSSATTTSTNDS